MRDGGVELAPYAAHAAASRGRRHPEPPPSYRTEFQRDRDRVIHSTAFRRLVYKTQVFVNYEGDLYRTRLTHSLEVAQIARTVARALSLNEDLVEAISLAHDLGHTPFGHAGQDALNACMRDFGGFEHNLQSLRVVDELEERYPTFRGVNLTFETREGILKHCSLKVARELGDVGKRFLERRQPGLEAQLANIADEIAYNNHDVDDGLRSGLITLEQLAALPFFAENIRAVERAYPGIKPARLGAEAVRRMIGELVTDLLQTSAATIAAAAPSDIDQVRAAPGPLIRFSGPMQETQLALKRFLRDSLYSHPRVRQMTQQAQDTVRLLFDALSADYGRMPDEHAERARAAAERGDPAAAARVVADYIAGMTDRFALQTRDALREK
ncbi:MAG TPA: deoxyguanosinetriphosphate triphosphohydrolase [Gammaproteobacteria bacterium]|nr:deoxyguanosinetriphosphate triphosphohydrolase [Gammaproteobacteria bacterium]